MGNDYRIGVIAPHLDGEYYGRLLPNIHQAVRARLSQLIAIPFADDREIIDIEERLASFDLIDAWILIVPSHYVTLREFLERSGKPVVYIGNHPLLEQGHAVVANNRQTMREAVQHLIEHGHREIAFIGKTDNFSVHERYLGYREALQARGIPIDDKKVIWNNDNSIEGGISATERLLLNGVSFTAIAAGTDLNAFGAISSLSLKGITVPQEVAVIGFDDIYQSAIHSPALTTVRQPYEELASRAVERTFDLLAGKSFESRLVNVPARIVVRSSCGCEEDKPFTSQAFESQKQDMTQLRTTLHNLTINSHKMTRGFILATKEDTIQISDLFWNLSHWGCLTLWEEDGRGGRRLVVAQAFGREGDPLPPIGGKYKLEHFPPVDYLPAGTRNGGEDFVIVHSVKSDLKDWGYIALAGPVDRTNILISNDLTRHSFAILAVALDRELLFNQVRAIADKLEIVSRTTNDGIWDWNLKSNKIRWNIRAHKMLSGAAAQLNDAPSSLFQVIHADDQTAVLNAFSRPFQKNQAIQTDFRVRVADDQFIWVCLAGDIVWGEDGDATDIIGSFTDVTEKKANEERFIQMAYQDALTGLPNRLLFQERLRKTMEERLRDGMKLAVLMIDLDRFKIVNDTLGHQAGDLLLQRAATILKECVGPQDTIARLGGDEFIVLLSCVEGNDEIARIADLMLQKLSKPFQLGGQQFFLSASVGASIFPTHDSDPDTLMRYADLAMYHTKDGGGNRFRIYTPDLSYQRVERFNMENGLRRALDNDEFVLNFQPQISLGTGKIYGAEALIRWHMPDGAIIQPTDFIPLAEETGLIIPIGQWVLEKACQECKRWIDAGMPSLVISVNLSAQQFQQPDFPEQVRKVLRETGIQPYNLCLEVTEYTAVQDLAHSVRMLDELVSIGVKIALDDFGIGQSSLLLLKKLPVHVVKIDPSFILNIIEDTDDNVIAKAVIEMSHSLGLSVTAEGVETESQLHRLQQLNCDRIQGFFTGRPMASNQFIGYYKEILDSF